MLPLASKGSAVLYLYFLPSACLLVEARSLKGTRASSPGTCRSQHSALTTAASACPTLQAHRVIAKAATSSQAAGSEQQLDGGKGPSAAEGPEEVVSASQALLEQHVVLIGTWVHVLLWRVMMLV